MWPIGLRTCVGPGNHVLDGVQIPQGKGSFEGGKGWPIVKYWETLQSSVQKQLNRTTGGDAIWVLGSDWPKESWIRCGTRSFMGRGNFLGKGHPLTFCRELCKNGWTDRFAVWVVDSGGHQEAQLQSYSPPGEYHWTIHLLRYCGLMGQITLTTCYYCTQF